MTGTDIQLPLYLFHQGTNFRAYDLLGCHVSRTEDGRYRSVFRVWAPNAREVRVVGDVCGWAGGAYMERVSDGVWQAEVVTDFCPEGTFYKYAVTRGDTTRLKADPYAFSSQTLGETASVIRDLSSLSFTDGRWMRGRSKTLCGRTGRTAGHFCPSPVNIYEMNLASWHTRDDAPTEDGAHYLNYREIADRLVPYLTDMGYTHVELMPVMEHPFDGSWGYQITGYYAPTSRFGTPDDFAYFVNTLHNAGIGVILDWVPAHFPKDAHGLYEFDGGPLYEYQGADRMEHAGWGTRFFDVGRPEVQSFLISNALFWMRTYHADGLRVDAVAAMLYLDFDRKPGEWVPNAEGGNRNLEAVAFFKKLNTAVFAEFPDIFMIAEESTAWPMITKPVHEGGLGFNFKWNMGFANDLFDYVAKDPVYRRYEHNRLTFPMVYAFSENYILPVSHDEVVHGKKSLIDKMFGAYDDKFSMMRAYLTYMMTMPGKKLLFMGTEFAQFREWDFANALEWFMLKYPRHDEMRKYVRALNHLYLDTPALWEIDDGWDGFKWIYPDRADDNMVAYERFDASHRSVTVLINFSPNAYRSYAIPVEPGARYDILLGSDEPYYGGKGFCDTSRTLRAEKGAQKDGKANMYVDLPAYSALILKRH